MTDIVIVDADTLRAVGLARLLDERYGLSSVITDDPKNVGGITDATLYFVTPAAFASQPYYYVPRRDRVVLVGSLSTSPLPVINPADSVERLEASLDNVIRSLGATKSPATLSHREAEVLRLIAAGRINKEIADELGISFNTVLTHRKNITSKLGLKNVAALTLYAVMNGLISDPQDDR